MSRYRFGTFDFDSDTADLRREGTPVRLQAQPGQVLAILLEHAGDIVTRETLQQTVWADGTQVDFERGLNYCIAQVRSALGDSADSPRFVRTIPKKGYQFIAPVERVIEATVQPPSKPKTARWMWPVLAGAAVLALAGFALANRFEHHVPVIAVCLFDNETGDRKFDQIAIGFSDAVTVELASEGAQRVKVIGNAEILRTPRSERKLTEISKALGADFVIIGQIKKDATQFRILGHLLRMPGQTHASVERLDASQLDNPLADEAEFAHRAAQRFLKAIDSGGSQAVRSR
jgi:DNA-binding winged helix-turn-helix (wHTH) protein/TolB-like protein